LFDHYESFVSSIRELSGSLKMHKTTEGAKGWAQRGKLLWKSENRTLNLGIQSNTEMFNPWIKKIKIIE